MEKLSTLLISMIVLVLVSCNNSLLPDLDEGDPVFLFEGEIGGEQFLIQAGREENAMQTGFFTDTTGVWYMLGTLGPRNCLEGCPEALQVRLYDFTPSVDYSRDRSFSFPNGIWPIASGRPISVDDTIEVAHFFLDSLLLLSQSPVLWDFQFGDTTSAFNPRRVLTSYRDLEVCLNTSHGSQAANICNIVPKRENYHCRYMFYYRQLSPLTFEFSSADGASYNWTFGDGQSSYGTTVTHTFPSRALTNRDRFRVCMESISGCETSFCREVRTDSGAFAGYTYQIHDSISTKDIPAGLAGKVLVTWKNADGLRYSNYVEGRSPQSSEVFQVKRLSPYSANADGYPTKKIEAEMQLWLFNEQNALDSIFIDARRFVFALPNP
jgi:hypothetical protein